MSSNYIAGPHDPQPADSMSNTSYTDKTCFYTPYNQSMVSKSNFSQEKGRRQSQDPIKYKLTTEILKRVSKTENLSQIIQLNLDGNSRFLKYRLKLISGMHNLMNLKDLNLSNNDIEKIENLNNLKNLHILNLSFNKISKLENISALKQLEVLNLSNNLIEEIPPIIIKNVNLIDLDLANNMIATKQSVNNLKTLNKLTNLNLSANPICDISGYPGFVAYCLKKLVSLDGRSTSSNAKPYVSPHKALKSSGNQTNQTSTSRTHRNVPDQQTTIDNLQQHDRNLSYEERLMITQNRLNELNLLSNRQELVCPDDEASFDNNNIDVNQVNTLDVIHDNDEEDENNESNNKNTQRFAAKVPEIGVLKSKQESDRAVSDQERTGRFKSKANSRGSFAFDSIDKSTLKDKPSVDIYSTNYNSNGNQQQTESTHYFSNQERRRQKSAQGSMNYGNVNNKSLDTHDNALYSFSGSGYNSNLRLDPQPEVLEAERDSEIQLNNLEVQKPRLSLKNRQIDEESAPSNGSKQLLNLPNKNSSSQYSSNFNSNQRYHDVEQVGQNDADFLLNRNEFSSPKTNYGFKNIYRGPVDGNSNNMKIEDEETNRNRIQPCMKKNIYYATNEDISTVKKEPRDTLSFGNFPGTSEKENISREIGDASIKIKDLQIEIEQKLFNYDNTANIINSKKKNVLNVVDSLDDILENLILQTGNINLADNKFLSLNERSEILIRMKDFLELMDYHTEQHINYFLILNQMGLAMDSSDDINEKRVLELSEVENIDATFESLSQQIDQIFNKLEVVNLQIFNIKNQVDQISLDLRSSNINPSSKGLNEKLDLSFEDLYRKFDDLINNDVVRIKLFMDIKVLYTSIWKLTKDLTNLENQKSNLNLDTQPFIRNHNSSPKKPEAINTHDNVLQAMQNVLNQDLPVNSPGSSRPASALNNMNMYQIPESNFPESQRSMRDSDSKGLSSSRKSARSIADKENDYPSKCSRNGYSSIGKENASPDLRLPQRIVMNSSATPKNVPSAFKGSSTKKSQKGRTSLPDKNEDFVFQQFTEVTENDAAASQQGASDQKNSSQYLSNEAQSEVYNQNIDLRGSMRSGLEESNRKIALKRSESVHGCEHCMVKDNTLKIAQEEIMNVHRERAHSEMEANYFKSELARIQKELEESHARYRTDLLERTMIQDQEREQFNNALLLLSDMCDKNRMKLDEIRIKIVSASKAHYPSAAIPFQAFVSIQTSTIEDLLTTNGKLQEEIGVFISDFKSALIPQQNLAASHHSNFGIMSKGVQVSNIERSQVLEHHTGRETPINIGYANRRSVSGQVEVDADALGESHSGNFDQMLPHGLANTSHNLQSGVNQSQDFYIKQDANYTWNTNEDYNMHKSHSNIEPQENVESRMDESDLNTLKPLIVNRPENQINAAAEYKSSNEYDRVNQHNNHQHQHQFSLNILNPDDEIQKPPITLGQLTFHKNDIHCSRPDSNTNLNHILFGNNSSDTAIRASKRNSDVQPTDSEVHLLTENDFRDTSKEKLPSVSTTYSPFRYVRPNQVTRINGSMLSNLQENIAQHLRENNKGHANKHLKKISTNIYQYKGLKDKVTEKAFRKTAKSSSAFGIKGKVNKTFTPSRSAKLSSSPMITNRRATLMEKNYNTNDNSTKGFTSVRSTVDYSRPQIDTNQVFRKPSSYKSTNDRDVNVDLNQLLSGRKKVLESQEITSYHEKFDLYSPYHPVHSGLAVDNHRIDGRLLSIKVSSNGRSSPLIKSVERTLNW